MMEVNTIIWDWNGTLLDDIEICIEAINALLNDRNLPLLDKENYLNVFGFPVKDYYRRIGFDFEKESFDIPAHQFIEKYSSAVKKGKLHSGVQSILERFNSKGYQQFVLSASEQASLEMLLKHYKINHWFKAVAGLNNHFATSKEEIGIQLLRKHHITPKNACLIGDTIHDFEVAEAMGCKCILIAKGHQSFERLEKTGTAVVKDLAELESFFKN